MMLLNITQCLIMAAILDFVEKQVLDLHFVASLLSETIKYHVCILGNVIHCQFIID